MTGKIGTVGIIGAGQMGGGIAHVSALAGYKVRLYDISSERIEAGLATINGNMARQVSSGKMEEDVRKSAASPPRRLWKTSRTSTSSLRPQPKTRL